MSKPLMCHVVAGYPDRSGCLELIRGLAGAGVAAIEVQVPFSDPIADGETIMRANDQALAGGMTTAGSFELIREAGVSCDVYVMSYLQKVYRFGPQEFCDEARKSGVKGLIVPDMPYDSPDCTELKKLAGSLELVPVLSPGMPGKRLDDILKAGPASVYVTSQRGITGNAYHGGGELEQLVKIIREKSEARIMIGFGISMPQDVGDALKLGDLAVIGSALIKRFQESGQARVLDLVKELAEAAG
jgi:tryptophan synthase alpha chain